MEFVPKGLISSAFAFILQSDTSDHVQYYPSNVRDNTLLFCLFLQGQCRRKPLKISICELFDKSRCPVLE